MTATLICEYEGHRTEFRCNQAHGEDLFHKRCRAAHKMIGLRRIILYSEDWRVLEQSVFIGGEKPLYYVAKRLNA